VYDSSTVWRRLTVEREEENEEETGDDVANSRSRRMYGFESRTGC
jgi:hypothetical protein